MLDVIMIGPYPEDPSLIKGGVQASLYGLSRALLAQPEVRGVTGISLPLKAEAGKEVRTGALSGVTVTYLSAPYRLLASAVIHVPRILKIVRAFENPVAHIHGTGLLQAMLAALFRLLHIPFVWTLHGITEKEMLARYQEARTFSAAARYFFYSALERLTLRWARDIFVDTPYVRDAIRTKNRVHVLPIGIFTKEFAPLRESPRDEPVILSLGVIDPRKGHHFTIEAFALVQKMLPPAKLVIAGSLTVPEYFEALQAQAKKLGLTDCVEFAIDRPWNEILALLGRARLFALHSQEESQGIALCEALASGLPIIATRIGGIPFVVTEGADGFLVPYGEVIGFADAMGRLLADTALYARMAWQAARSSMRFDWESIAAEVVKVYGEAIQAR